MQLPIFQIDAFADKIFAGNPAAICPLDTWLPDSLMQTIAQENNLSETAFFVPTQEGFHIRWFTPTTEVDLCGHATLASAYVLFNILKYEKKSIVFDSKSGTLNVSRDNEWFVLDFPAKIPVPCVTPKIIIKAFSKSPIECLQADDYLVVFENEKDVLSVVPDIEQLKKLDLRGVIITATSNQYDFVSRFFAPNYGIVEDPVTGSAHTQLIPYWAQKLDKTQLLAKQTSSRGGILRCELKGKQVTIAGQAVKYLEGTIEI